MCWSWDALCLPSAEGSVLICAVSASAPGGPSSWGSLPVVGARCDRQGADCPGHCQHSPGLREEWGGGSPKGGECTWAPCAASVGSQQLWPVFSHFSYFVSHLTNPSVFLLCFFFFSLFLSILLPQPKEAEPEEPPPLETNLAEQSEQPPEANDAEPAARPNAEVSEVEIPSVGRILVRSAADGYDEEVQTRVQDSAACCQSCFLPTWLSALFEGVWQQLIFSH